ncbi:MAG: hypothetical protein U9Q69_01695 [Nanoarchaeota archaeon]|nr:hypothetical protein [Nanoarchaeota archaeon]
MGKLPLDKLFSKKLKLHKIKYNYLYKIFYVNCNYFKRYYFILALKDIIDKEILIHNKILKKISKIHKKNKRIRKFNVLKFICDDINKALSKEYSIISGIGLFSILKNDWTFIFSNKIKSSYLRKKYLEFKEMFELELELNNKFTSVLYKLNIQLLEFKEKKKDYIKGTKLLKEAQTKFKDFIGVLDNKSLVQQKGKELLNILERFRGNIFYQFIQYDISNIQKKVKYVLAHPKESKFTYLFTGIYLVAPGTFELTGAILAVRYVTKYTMNKTKALAKPSRDKSLRKQLKRKINKGRKKSLI